MKPIKTIFLSVLFAGSLASRAQSPVLWHDPLAGVGTAEVDYIHGRGFAQKDYTRLPESAGRVVREAVWSLSRNSAGLYLQFTTDSPEITVQYEVTEAHAMPHMPATGMSGVDLYNDRGERCWGSYSFGNPIVYTYRELPDTTGTGMTYTLYLPLYNTVRKLKIGVREGSAFEFVPTETQLPIVVYGTSIAQGACASRPGMAWTNLLQRMTGRPVVNLGFSGNGKLEPEVIDYVASVPAALYVVDCMPNMYVPEDSIYTLVTNAVRQFRQARQETPILLVEHPGYANRQTNAAKRADDERADRAQRRAFADLRRQGLDGLYYLSRRDLRMPADGMVDYIHPSDYGMEAYARAYHRAVEKILKRKSR